MNLTVLQKGNQFRVFDCNTDDDLFYAFAKEGVFFLSGDAYAGAIIPMQVIMHAWVRWNIVLSVLKRKLWISQTSKGNAAVNYTDRETPWTRIIEHKMV